MSISLMTRTLVALRAGYLLDVFLPYGVSRLPAQLLLVPQGDGVRLYAWKFNEQDSTDWVTTDFSLEAHLYRKIRIVGQVQPDFYPFLEPSGNHYWLWTPPLERPDRQAGVLQFIPAFTPVCDLTQEFPPTERLSFRALLEDKRFPTLSPAYIRVDEEDSSQNTSGYVQEIKDAYEGIYFQEEVIFEPVEFTQAQN